MEKEILDPCCGSRMFYFNKENPLVDFRDNREVHETLCDGRILNVAPDTIGDVRHIDAPDGAYSLVVFDPPHLKYGAGWQCEKYGRLPAEWRSFLHDAFAECWRVLKPGGTLVFKWNEYHISLRDVLACFDTTHGDTCASADLTKYAATHGTALDNTEKVLLELWDLILEEAKKTKNYDPALTYGVYQITKELNTFHVEGSGKSKKKIYDYPGLNGYLRTLRAMLKAYYKLHITAKMFKYQLLK